ncbi:MAG: hypothetical protein RSE29_08895 [Leclercia sp.]
MSIIELTAKVKAAAQQRTAEERLELLKDAHILTTKGVYNRRFFTEETVAKSRNKAKVEG